MISHVCKQAVAAGLDPSIGVTHSNDRNQIPLVYDLMEPLRPVVDRRILEFALGNVFSPGDFTINKVGGCRLNPQMIGPVVRAIDIPADRVVADFRRMLCL